MDISSEQASQGLGSSDLPHSPEDRRSHLSTSWGASERCLRARLTASGGEGSGSGTRTQAGPAGWHHSAALSSLLLEAGLAGAGASRRKLLGSRPTALPRATHFQNQPSPWQSVHRCPAPASSPRLPAGRRGLGPDQTSLGDRLFLFSLCSQFNCPTAPAPARDQGKALPTLRTSPSRSCDCGCPHLLKAGKRHVEKRVRREGPGPSPPTPPPR